MNIIVAVDKNWAIGKDNKLLVSIPADMKMFREETSGKVVVMGRKTLEGAANPQVAGKGAGHEQALQKAHACKSPHAEDRAGSSYNDSGNLRCRADARASVLCRAGTSENLARTRRRHSDRDLYCIRQSAVSAHSAL